MLELEAERTRLQSAIVEVQAQGALAAKQTEEKMTLLRGALIQTENLIQQRDRGVAAAEALCKICG